MMKKMKRSSAFLKSNNQNNGNRPKQEKRIKMNTTQETIKSVYAYCDKNPYYVYGDRNDCVTDEMAEMLISGQFESFNESIWEWELHNEHYNDWDSWESEFAESFGFDSWADIPEELQELARDNRYTDQSDYIETCLRNWRGNVVAHLIKRNGDYIEFPCVNDYNAKENSRLQAYLKTLGINGHKWEALYANTYLVALGTIDLLEIYKTQKAPKFVTIGADDFLLGFNGFNGSGTAESSTGWLAGKSRKFKAVFNVDGASGYGVDQTFGFIGRCWQNELSVS